MSQAADEALARAGVDQDWISAVEQPEAASAAAQAALDTASPFPTLEAPVSSLVDLPGGLLYEDKVITQAEVRELTGEHEEALSRAAQADNLYFFINTLLECGVRNFGDEPEAKTKFLLKKCLVGDRDELILGIRKATYGENVTLVDWVCPICGEKSTLTVPLSDMERKRLESPRDDQEFEVPLRKGGTAKVRLANGEDQAAVFADSRLTSVQRDSIQLQRCLITVSGQPVAGRAGAMALAMSIPDRHAIIKELAERQPGPRFEVKFTHEDCGKVVTLGIGMGDLFPPD